VQVEVGQEWADTAALNRSLLATYPLPVLQHTCPQPFLDEAQHAPVRNPVPDERFQPCMPEGVEKGPQVGVEHPVHLPLPQSDGERVQRLVLATPGSEPVRETNEVDFVDGVEHLDGGSLDDLVFQSDHSDRPLPTVRLRYVRPTGRLGSVRSLAQPAREVPEVFLQALPVLLPRLPVDSGRRIALDAEVRAPEPLYVADVVEERGEPLFPVLPCCLTYPLERTLRAGPALCPGRVLLSRVPLGQPPSLDPLRRRSPGLVRGLLRYYGAVPTSQVRASLGCVLGLSGAACGHPLPPGRPGISRFPCEVFPRMLGVCDRAGSLGFSR
jgi:hypothetical protein